MCELFCLLSMNDACSRKPAAAVVGACHRYITIKRLIQSAVAVVSLPRSCVAYTAVARSMVTCGIGANRDARPQHWRTRMFKWYDSSWNSYISRIGMAEATRHPGRNVRLARTLWHSLRKLRVTGSFILSEWWAVMALDTPQ